MCVYKNIFKYLLKFKLNNNNNILKIQNNIKIYYYKL